MNLRLNTVKHKCKGGLATKGESMALSEEQKQIEDLIMSDISRDNLLEHIRWLGENAAPRLSGTPACRKAAEYIVKVNHQNGVAVNSYEFMAYMCSPEKATVTIISPEEREIEAYAYAFTPATPPGGLEGEIVAAGIGTEEDLEEVDVKGKVCFVKFSGYFPISYNEKIRVAERHGAIAFLHQNWTPPERRLFHYGSAKHVWGVPTLTELRDPTPESFAHIPALCTTRQDGDYIRELLLRGKVRIRIKSATYPKWAKIVEPVATVTGTWRPNRFVLVGGHFDAYGGGATDNAVGNAVCLELARIFQKYSHKLRRSIRIGWWNGHETAKQSGSTWYLDNFWDDFSKNCLVYINIDSPGTAAEKDLTGPTMFYGSGAPIINQFVQDVVKDLARRLNKPYAGDTVGDILVPPGAAYRIFKAGDQSFLGVGVPSIAIGTKYTPEFMTTVKTVSTSFQGWWYHSEEDTLDKVDLDALVETAKAIAVFIARLSNMPIIPTKTVPVADWMLEGLKEHNKNGKGLLDLTNLIAKVEKFKEVALELDKTINALTAQCDEWGDVTNLDKKIDEANACLMKLSRVLDPINYTHTGKYGQDRWGDLPKPIPGLQKIDELVSMNRDSGEFTALMTELIRERNKVSDALDETIIFCKKTLKILV